MAIINISDFPDQPTDRTKTFDVSQFDLTSIPEDSFQDKTQPVLGRQLTPSERPTIKGFEELQERRRRTLERGGFEDTETIQEDIQKSIALGEAGLRRVGGGFREILGGITDVSQVRGETPFGEALAGARGFQRSLGGVQDVIIGGISTLASPLPTLLPDFLEKPLNVVAGALGSLGAKGITALIKGLGGDPSTPESIKTIEAASTLAQLAGFRGVAKITAKVTKPLVTKATAKIQEAVGKQREAFTQELIKPIPSKVVKLTETKTGLVREKGIFQRERPTTFKQKEIAKDVAKIEGVKTSNTKLQNNNAIVAKKNSLGKQLESDIKSKDNPIFNKRELNSNVSNKSNVQFKESIILRGDPAKSGNLILNKFNQFLEKEGFTALGLLRSRKKLDTWIKDQSKNALDPKTISALSEGARIVRNNVNDFLAKKAKNTKVKASLREQSNLFKAIDEIAPKAVAEAGTAIGRTVQNLHNSLGFKGEALTALGTLGFTTAGLGAWVLGLGVTLTVIKGVTTVVLSTKAKQALSAVLKKAQTGVEAAPPIAIPKETE